MKYPVVIPYKRTPDSGRELRYTLRSLKNINNFNGQVFIVGDLEPWLTHITHIRAPKISYSPYQDVENKILAVINDLRVADDFIYMNDDFYVTQPTEVKDLHGGEIPDNEKGYHNMCKVTTKKFLQGRGIEKPLNYSIHVPMIMNKQKRLEVHKLIKPHLRGTTILARIVYGNLFIQPHDAEYYEDKKTKSVNLKDGMFISTQYYTDSLDKLFPEKSIYERDKIVGKYTVSVIMPIYNEQELILKALQSIPKNVSEIIIVDDGSTDNTISIVKDWAKTDSRAKVYENDKNRGVGYTINRCYDLATCDYTVILSGDDYMHPTMSNVIKKIDGSDFVFFNLTYNVKGKIRRPSQLNYKSWAGSCKLVKRSFMDKVRASNKLVNEDLELYQQLLKKPHTTLFTNIMGKHYNTPRHGSLTDRKQKGEFGQQYVTVGYAARWKRWNSENPKLSVHN